VTNNMTRRERPKIFRDPATGKPAVLYNGACPPSSSDNCFTIAAPFVLASITATMSGSSSGVGKETTTATISKVIDEENSAPRVPLYRCFSAASGKHWSSTDVHCGGVVLANDATNEGLLGYAAASRSSETPRSLRLCEVGEPRGSAAWYQYHSLDAPCKVGHSMHAFVGFVH
jgi:hypothetical protein